MSTEIRDAREDDAEFLGRVMLSASRSHVPRGIWEYIFDWSADQAQRFCRRIAVSDEVHWNHYKTFYVAEVDGQPAAALCGADPTVHGMTAFQPVLTREAGKIGIDVDNLDALTERTNAAISITPEYVDGAWLVENVACLPEFRRRGLVDLLLKHALVEGRERGFRCGQLSVFIDNIPAISAYLRVGFELDVELRNPEIERVLGFPGVFRMLNPFR
jgi:ribosomal protein S18 acetylase RimI-like enzyme